MNTTAIGRKGEDIAAELLAEAGYAIVERNAVIGHVEVDIVAMKHNRIIMVEVKTRDEGTMDVNYGIDREKLYRLSRAGDMYVRFRNLPHEVQIDVILVTNKRDGTVTAEHFPDVCMPPVRHRRR